MVNTVELKTFPLTPTIRVECSKYSKDETLNKVYGIFQKFRDEIWSYLKNIYQIARRGFKIVAVKIPKFEPKMLKAIAALGLAHAINVALIISKYPSNINDFLSNLTMNDIEGVVLSGISLLMNPLDAIDSAITFATSAATLELIPVITIFSMIALPIAITLLSYGCLKGVYDLVRLGIHKHQTPHQVATMSEMHKLKAQLEKKIRVTTEERSEIETKYAGDSKKINHKIEVLKSRKINILKRHTDQIIVNIMTNLLEHLESNPKALGKTNEALSDIHTLMNRKITTRVVSTVTTMAMLTSIVASVQFPVSALLIPIVALIKHTISIAQSIYIENLYTAGLNCQQMTKQKI